MMGKELTDPQTHQSLGHLESPCCDVVVDRVTPTMSYGHLENPKTSVETVVPTALLLITSVAECWLPGRSAEVTDAIMALALGVAFAMLPETERQSAATAPSPQEIASEHALDQGCWY